MIRSTNSYFDTTFTHECVKNWRIHEFDHKNEFSHFYGRWLTVIRHTYCSYQHKFVYFFRENHKLFVSHLLVFCVSVVILSLYLFCIAMTWTYKPTNKLESWPTRPILHLFNDDDILSMNTMNSAYIRCEVKAKTEYLIRSSSSRAWAYCKWWRPDCKIEVLFTFTLYPHEIRDAKYDRWDWECAPVMEKETQRSWKMRRNAYPVFICYRVIIVHI